MPFLPSPATVAHDGCALYYGTGACAQCTTAADNLRAGFLHDKPDAAAYCLDAPESIPAGSTRWRSSEEPPRPTPTVSGRPGHAPRRPPGAAAPGPVAVAPQTIDLTPTWRGVLPALLLGYVNGTAQGRTLAEAELLRLCRIADELVPALARALQGMLAGQRPFAACDAGGLGLEYTADNLTSEVWSSRKGRAISDAEAALALLLRLRYA